MDKTISDKTLKEIQSWFNKVLHKNKVSEEVNLNSDDICNISIIINNNIESFIDNNFKKEHQKTIEYIDKMYNEVDLHNNVTRIINKTTPSK